jgi:hypothetical protein
VTAGAAPPGGEVLPLIVGKTTRHAVEPAEAAIEP